MEGDDDEGAHRSSGTLSSPVAGTAHHETACSCADDIRKAPP